MSQMDRAARWALDRPFALAVIVLLIVVLPGFLRIEHAVNEARSATEANTRLAESNRAIAACLTKWAAEQTDALQDRDAVNKTARAAQQDMWEELQTWLTSAPRDADRTLMIESIARYRRVLARLQRHEAINPYPDISPCFVGLSPANRTLLEGEFRTVAYRRGYCLGRRVTMWGTHRADTIHGTDRGDVIAAKGGGDLILAGEGADRICAGRGGDTVNGGRGWDRADGQRGDDLCIQTEREQSC